MAKMLISRQLPPFLLWAILACCFWGSPAQAQEDTGLASSPPAQIHSFDVPKTLDARTLQQLPEERWTPGHPYGFNFGYDKEQRLFRIDFLPSASGRYVLELDYPLLDTVELYQIRDGELVMLHQTGDAFPFSSRPLHHRGFAFPLELDATSDSTFYVRVSTQSAMKSSLEIGTLEEHLNRNMSDMLFHGIFLGFLTVFFLFSMFLAFLYKEPSYALYTVTAFFFLLFSLSWNGLGFAYLWPNYPPMNRIAMPYSTSAMLVMSIYFSKFFYLGRIIERTWKLAWLFNLLILLSLTLLVLPWVGTGAYASRASATLGLVVGLFLSILSVYYWVKEQRQVGYFALGWISYILGMSYIGFNSLGILADNRYSDLAMSLGMLLNAAFLTIALNNKHFQTTQQMQRNREEFLELQQRANARLEKQVEERTKSLQELNQLLVRQKIEANQQTESLKKANDELRRVQREMQRQREHSQSWSFQVRKLADLAGELASHASPNKIVETTFRMVKNEMRADYFALGFIDGPKQQIVFVDSYFMGQIVPVMAYDWDSERGPALHVIEKEPTICPDGAVYKKNPFFSNIDLLVKIHPSSSVYVPVWKLGKPLGLMIVHSKEPNSYNQDHVSFLKFLSMATAITIDNSLILSQKDEMVRKIQENSSENLEMVKTNRDLNAEVRKLNHRVRSLFQRFDQPIAWVNRKGQFFMVNNKFATTFGYLQNELSLKRYRDLLPPKSLALLQEEFKRAHGKKTTLELELDCIGARQIIRVRLVLGLLYDIRQHLESVLVVVSHKSTPE